MFDFAQYRPQAAAGEEIFHIVIAGGLEIHQHRRLVADLVQPVKRHVDAGAPGDGGQVNDAVSRAADGEQYAERVLD